MARLKFCNKSNIICFCVALSLYALFQNMKFIYLGDSENSSNHLENLNDFHLRLVQDENKRLDNRSQPILDEDTTLKLNTIYTHLNMSNEIKTFPAAKLGEYLLLNPGLCGDARLIDIIILVHTAPHNLKNRENIRQTFANKSLFSPFQVRVAFLMGKPNDDALSVKLNSEHEKNADTVMGDFIDDYHNLTLKGVMGFRWISQFCSNSKFVLKIDDDVIVDTYKLLTTYIPHMKDKKKSFFCNVWRKNMRIERTGKWAVPSHMFANMNVFPYYYCSGFTLLMTRDLVEALYKAARVTPFFWIDDLYLFGILPFVVGDVTFYDYQIGKNISLNQEETLECLNKLGSQCNYFSTALRRESYDVSYFPMWTKIQSLYDRRSWRSWRPLTFFEP